MGQDINFHSKAAKTYNLDSVIYYSNKQIDLLSGKQDSGNIITECIFVANRCLQYPKYSLAKHYIDKGFAYLSSKNITQRYQLLSALGTYYKYTNNDGEALKNYILAFNYFKKIKDYSNLLKAHTDLVEFYRKKENYVTANQFASEALQMIKSEHLSDTSEITRFYSRVAAVKNETSMHDSSLYYSRMALALARKQRNYYAVANCYNEIAFSLGNKPDSAYGLYRVAGDIWLSIDANREGVLAYHNSIRLFSHKSIGPKQKSIQLYHELLKLIEEKKIEANLTGLYSDLANDYGCIGDSTNYYKYKYFSHESLFGQVRNENKRLIEDITQKYENDKVKSELTKTNELLRARDEAIRKGRREKIIIYVSILVLLVLAGSITYLLILRSRANKLLQRQNKEKDALVQEIHHRVKNNLQFISSLINMQSNASSDERDVNTLNDASRRVRAMALVHEMLYSQSDLSGIDIKNYISELIHSINDLVNTNNIPVDFQLHVESHMLSTNQTIALGMITSELISNSFKYAITPGKQALIRIEFYKREDGYHFEMSDNGPGTNNVANAGKLGMRLIGIFSKQINGQYNFSNRNGLVFDLIFK